MIRGFFGRMKAACVSALRERLNGSNASNRDGRRVLNPAHTPTRRGERSVTAATVPSEPLAERSMHAPPFDYDAFQQAIDSRRVKAKRITGNPGGNAHDRRKARRAYRAHLWYMAQLRKRVGEKIAA